METQIRVLNQKHSSAKKSFESGNLILDNYLKHYALQDQRRLQSVCFILENIANQVIGYYTLSASSIETALLDPKSALSLGAKYTQVPVILIGRFAIDAHFQRSGFGKHLLMDALNRCAKQSEQMGACAVFVDPIDEQAKIFYLKFGFLALPNQSKLFMPIKTLQSLFQAFH